MYQKQVPNATKRAAAEKSVQAGMGNFFMADTSKDYWGFNGLERVWSQGLSRTTSVDMQICFISSKQLSNFAFAIKRLKKQFLITTIHRVLFKEFEAFWLRVNWQKQN